MFQILAVVLAPFTRLPDTFANVWLRVYAAVALEFAGSLSVLFFVIWGVSIVVACVFYRRLWKHRAEALGKNVMREEGTGRLPFQYYFQKVLLEL